MLKSENDHIKKLLKFLKTIVQWYAISLSKYNFMKNVGT